MAGKVKDSLNVRPAYGVSLGPWSVPVQCRRFEGVVGKAEMERSLESMRVISSDWRLRNVSVVVKLVLGDEVATVS